MKAIFRTSNNCGNLRNAVAPVADKYIKAQDVHLRGNVAYLQKKVKETQNRAFSGVLLPHLPGTELQYELMLVE